MHAYKYIPDASVVGMHTNTYRMTVSSACMQIHTGYTNTYRLTELSVCIVHDDVICFVLDPPRYLYSKRTHSTVREHIL